MNMKRQLLFLTLCFALTAGSSWAGIVGSTNPADFGDPVNWCQFGCTGAQFATPQSWTSVGGQTGSVGLVGTGQGFYNLQQGNSWFGNFAGGMGLVYNGVAFGNTAADIALTFDQAENGVGAFIQADYYGPFTATMVDNTAKATAIIAAIVIMVTGANFESHLLIAMVCRIFHYYC